MTPRSKSAIDEIQESIREANKKLKSDLEKASEEKAVELIADYKEEVGKQNTELDVKLSDLQKHIDDLDKKKSGT